MQEIQIEEDIKVAYRRVVSFPLGIKEVFESLMASFPEPPVRSFYGISYLDEAGQVVYKAAATTLSEAEAVSHGCEFMTISKGDYISETMLDWMSHTNAVKDVLMKLMDDPRFDNTTPCIEWYKSDEELICMVKIKKQ